MHLFSQKISIFYQIYAQNSSEYVFESLKIMSWHHVNVCRRVLWYFHVLWFIFLYTLWENCQFENIFWFTNIFWYLWNKLTKQYVCSMAVTYQTSMRDSNKILLTRFRIYSLKKPQYWNLGRVYTLYLQCKNIL